MVRKRSYFAKSNRRNLGEVFFNNLLASAQKANRESKRRKQQERDRALREEAKTARQRERDAEIARRRSESERQRQQKQLENERADNQKKQAKFVTLYERSKLLCKKHGLADGLAVNIAETAIKSGVMPSKIEADVILPQIQELRSSSLAQLREPLSDVLDKIYEERILLEGHFVRFSEEILKTLPLPETVADHPLLQRYATMKRDFDEVRRQQRVLREDLETLSQKIEQCDDPDEMRELYRLAELKKQKQVEDVERRLARFMRD